MGRKNLLGLFLLISIFGYAQNQDALVWTFQTLEYQSKVLNRQSQILLKMPEAQNINVAIYAIEIKNQAIDQMRQVIMSEILSQNTDRKDSKLEMKLDKIHQVLITLEYLKKAPDLKKIQALMNDIQILKRWFLPPKPYEKIENYPKQYRSYPKMRQYSHR